MDVEPQSALCKAGSKVLLEFHKPPGAAAASGLQNAFMVQNSTGYVPFCPIGQTSQHPSKGEVFLVCLFVV